MNYNAMWKKLRIAICEPRRMMILLWMRSNKMLPDKLYLSVLFRLTMGYWINWRTPKTFSEKLQWLKLYNRKPEYTQMVDKFAVKEYVAKLIGKEYVIPTLGVWDRVEDIDFDTLPNQFVLKTTHGGGGGGVVVCKDKANFDYNAAKIKLQKSMNSDIYRNFREWPYKHVQKRIIAEKYLNELGFNDLPDYKFYCFDGIPRYCQVIRDRNTKETIDFYDMEWNHMPFYGLNPIGAHSVIKNGISPVPLPLHLDRLIAVCEKLSKNIPFSRIDLYVVGNKEYFGEITFYPMSGLGEFYPKEWNYILGSWIKLPM